MLSKTDRKLLWGIMSRNESSLRKFYLIHKDNLLSFLRRDLEDQDAEEVLQDSFIACIESLRNFREQCSLKTFLYSIAKKKSIDKMRKKKMKKILFSYLPAHVVESLAIVFLKDDLDKKFLDKKIETVLNKLPNDYARILRLKYKEGYKVAEIAKRLKLTFKATESLLFRARREFVRIYTHHERQGLFTFEKTFQ